MRYASQAMIVAPQPEPAEAGADVLREGGNAVDAGIACALVQGVVDPLMCGIAGFGSCGIYMPGKKFHGYIDAHAPAPLAANAPAIPPHMPPSARGARGSGWVTPSVWQAPRLMAARKATARAISSGSPARRMMVNLLKPSTSACHSSGDTLARSTTDFTTWPPSTGASVSLKAPR